MTASLTVVRRSPLRSAIAVVMLAATCSMVGLPATADPAASASRFPTWFVPDKVATVQATGDVYVLGGRPTGPDNLVMHEHHGKWSKLATPSAWSMWAIAASPTGTVWIGGTTHGRLLLAKLTGNDWHPASLPGLSEEQQGSSYYQNTGIQTISASSDTNVWAGGSIYQKKTNSVGVVHLDGTSWAFIPTLTDDPGVTANSVVDLALSSSGTTNTWISEQTPSSAYLLEWNGTQMVTTKRFRDLGPTSIVTTSPTCVWAAPESGGRSGGVLTRTPPVEDNRISLMHYNGTTWTTITKRIARKQLVALTGLAVTGCTAVAVGWDWRAYRDYSTGLTSPLVIESRGTSIHSITPKPRGTSSRFTGIGLVSASKVIVAGNSGFAARRRLPWIATVKLR